jgi:hypothetical protein
LTSILKQPQKATVSFDAFCYSKPTTNISSFADLSSFEIWQQIQLSPRDEHRKSSSMGLKTHPNTPCNQTCLFDTLLRLSRLQHRRRKHSKDGRLVLKGIFPFLVASTGLPAYEATSRRAILRVKARQTEAPAR